MIAEQNTHRNEDIYDNHNNTHDNKATKPAVGVEKRTGLLEQESDSNAQDFSDCL